MKTFTARLKAHQARLRAGLADFAELCDVSVGTAWNYLHGFEPKPERQAAILKRLAAVRRRDVKPVRMGRPRNEIAK